jgi:hypothetical protein
MDVDFNPEHDDALRLTIDLTSTTFAFDLPKSFMRIQASEYALIVDFVSEETGGVLAGEAISYGDLYSIMQKRTRERKESMERHPCNLQLIDGGGNKAEGK